MGRNQDLYRSLISANAVQVSDDSELRNKDYESLGRHGQQYSKILESYSNHLNYTLSFKRTMKKVFFWVAIAIMALCIIGVIIFGTVVVFNANNEEFNIQDYLIPLFTALTSFLTVFIIIPKIIAKYLFNSNEDDVMKNVVSSIQDYDKYVRGDLRNKEDNLNHT